VLRLWLEAQLRRKDFVASISVTSPPWILFFKRSRDASGLSHAFDQPLQICGDPDRMKILVEKERVQHPLPAGSHILPSPQALVSSGVTPEHLTDSKSAIIA